ncbi:MAG: hypothetical protein JRI41_08130 [Deltaproteobacteria bacterium]|nr:hypothetical protein [Deltaproteobacteria bacterium]
MKERSIIFGGPMVRAILEGRKTQTRRVIKPQPLCEEQPTLCDDGVWRGHYRHLVYTNGGQDTDVDVGVDEFGPCPYGRPGDLLWVRETWGHYPASLDEEENVLYKATCENPPSWPALRGDITEYVVWHPSIFMPKKYARLWLRITNVRVERVQDISIKDVFNEGIQISVNNGKPLLRLTGNKNNPSPTDYLQEDYTSDDFIRAHFASLWDSLNAKRGHYWKSNPWAWCISFERIDHA